MSKFAARVSDSHSCPKKTLTLHQDGIIKTGSPNVTMGDQPAARTGDKISYADGSEGSIKTSNACLIINGQRAARINDRTDHDGHITSGMNTIQIADGDPFIEIGNEGIIEIGDNISFG